jgi:hypothetical protein
VAGTVTDTKPFIDLVADLDYGTIRNCNYLSVIYFVVDPVTVSYGVEVMDTFFDCQCQRISEPITVSTSAEDSADRRWQFAHLHSHEQRVSNVLG